jgi:hypothetical protein
VAIIQESILAKFGYIIDIQVENKIDFGDLEFFLIVFWRIWATFFP